MKDVGIGIVGMALYIVISIGVPIAIIGGGIWFYNDVIKDEPSRTTTSYRDDIEVKQDYTPNKASDTIGYEFERAFVDGCAGEAPRSACQCMFNYLDDNLTNSEFLSIADLSEQQMMSNENIVNAVVSCS